MVSSMLSSNFKLLRPFDIHVLYSIIVFLFPEEEVDGETLLGLSETMVSRLFPTMRLQVKFMKALEELKEMQQVPSNSGENE